MASTMSQSNHTRSTSLPTPKSPVMLKLDHELQKLQKLEASSSTRSPLVTVQLGLSGLAELYKLCVDDSLLTFHDQRQLAVAEGSSKLLHLSTAIKDVVISLRKSVVDGNQNLSGYFSCRKETARAIKALAVALRQVETTLMATREPGLEIMKVLRCVSIINVSVLDSLLQLLAAPMAKSKSPSLMSKLLMIRKTKSVMKETGNEIGDVDVALHAVFLKGEKAVDGGKLRLERLEAGLRGVEKNLSSVIVQLTKIRATVLKTIAF